MAFVSTLFKKESEKRMVTILGDAVGNHIDEPPRNYRAADIEKFPGYFHGRAQIRLCFAAKFQRDGAAREEGGDHYAAFALKKLAEYNENEAATLLTICRTLNLTSQSEDKVYLPVMASFKVE